MDTYQYTYSLVIPVYNSAKSLPLLYEAIQQVDSLQEAQLIFVNDASIDDSWSVLLSLKEKNSAIVLVDLVNNVGQHSALYCGLLYAEGQYIVTLDDDLQHDPAEIVKLKDTLDKENADLVYGIYATKKHSAIRNTGSKVFAAIVNKFASTPLKGSSFKLMKHELIDSVLKHQHFNFYLDEVLAWHSKKTSFTEVEHKERTIGSSGYSPITLMKMSVQILLNYTALPLKFITYLGLISSLISFGFGIYYILQKFSNETQTGFTAIVVSIFFSTGLILLALGIIGEYISRVFLLASGKPPFKIKQVER